MADSLKRRIERAVITALQEPGSDGSVAGDTARQATGADAYDPVIQAAARSIYAEVASGGLNDGFSLDHEEMFIDEIVARVRRRPFRVVG